MEEERAIPQDEGVPLIEGWMLGALLFPDAMSQVVRLPPANDANPP